MQNILYVKRKYKTEDQVKKTKNMKIPNIYEKQKYKTQDQVKKKKTEKDKQTENTNILYKNKKKTKTR